MTLHAVLLKQRHSQLLIAGFGIILCACGDGAEQQNGDHENHVGHVACTVVTRGGWREKRQALPFYLRFEAPSSRYVQVGRELLPDIRRGWSVLNSRSGVEWGILQMR